jgi:hypothetical protein
VESWGSRVREDPTTLVGQPASSLHELLDEVEEAFARSGSPLFVEIPSDRPVTLIGDSHGDWPAVSAALRHARHGPVPGRFVGLGDYVDRATWSEPDPAALPNGSIWNAAYLLAWNAAAPGEVVLLRGNHEAARQIPVPNPTLLRELGRAYPAEEASVLWERLTRALERLPLAARTANGVFLAHGGIPPADRRDPRRWRADDRELLEALLWSDPEFEHPPGRVVGPPYGDSELEGFLQEFGCGFMIKGHAPWHSGRAIYGGRLLTLHTSDLFSRFGEGGVYLAELPALPRISSLGEVTLRAWEHGAWKPRAMAMSTVSPAFPTSAEASGGTSSGPVRTIQ